MIGFRLILALLCAAAVLESQSGMAHAQTGPSFCSYSGNRYVCDYASMGSGNRPIDFTGFSQQPQLLEVTVNGYLPFFGDAQTFSTTFNNMNPSTFDSNFPGYLEINCGRGGVVYVASGAFYNMSYVQHLKFKDCIVYDIPAYGLADLQQLDYLGFEGGTIDSINPNAMAGLDLQKLTFDTNQIPRFRGQFEMVNCKFTSQVISPGLTFSWKNLTSAVFKAAGLNTVSADTFRYNTNLRYVDLSDNDFTSVPSELFTGLEKLSDVTLYNIDWQCTCANLWFVPYAVANNITLFGDFVCANAAGQTAADYYYSSCDTSDACNGASGVAMGDKCVSALGMTAIILAFLAFGVIIASLVLAILNKKELDACAPEGPESPEDNNNNEASGSGQAPKPASATKVGAGQNTQVHVHREKQKIKPSEVAK